MSTDHNKSRPHGGPVEEVALRNSAHSASVVPVAAEDVAATAAGLGQLRLVEPEEYDAVDAKHVTSSAAQSGYDPVDTQHCPSSSAAQSGYDPVDTQYVPSSAAHSGYDPVDTQHCPSSSAAQSGYDPVDAQHCPSSSVAQSGYDSVVDHFGAPQRAHEVHDADVPKVGSDSVEYARIDTAAKLGEGRFGTVFKATYKNQTVAAKTLDLQKLPRDDPNNDEKKSFIWESHLLTIASHPYVIAQVARVRQQDNLIVMLLELCDGDLTGAIQKANKANRQLEAHVVWRYFVQIASALKRIHSLGFVHKDLKTDNILLLGGDCRIGDFGVSQLDSAIVGEDTEVPDVSRNSCKDQWWIAPEEAAEKNVVTGKTDVFAMGLIAARMISGEYPKKKWRDWKVWRSDMRSGSAAERVQSWLPKAHPLHDIARQCLSHAVEDRCTAEDVERRLLAPEVVCAVHRSGGDKDPLAAACQSILRHHQTLQVFERRRDVDMFVDQHITEESLLKRHTGPDEPKISLRTWLKKWVQLPRKEGLDSHTCDAESKQEEKATSPVAVVLGDGGTGKTLVSFVLAASQDVSNDRDNRPVQYVWLRYGLAPHWRQESMRNGLVESLKRGYGFSDDMVARLKAQKSPQVVFWLDAFDEVQGKADYSVKSLPLTLGLDKWPHAKLVITCRRNTVPTAELTSCFHLYTPPDVRYVLPLTAQQVQRYLDVGMKLLSPDHAQVLENPFLLALYRSSHRQEAQDQDTPLTRQAIYAQAVRWWCEEAERLLNRHKLEDAVLRLRGGYQSLHDSFEACAKAVAVRMFKDRNNTTFSAAEEQKDNESTFGLWLQGLKVVEEVAGNTNVGSEKLSKSDFVSVKMAVWRSWMKECPLQDKGQGTWSFLHKSVRDYFVALSLVSPPVLLSSPTAGILTLNPAHPLCSVLVTDDVAVQRFVAEFVDVSRARALVPRILGKSEEKWEAPAPSHDFTTDMLLIIRHSRSAPESPACTNATANCLTTLCTAGVDLIRCDLRGIKAGRPSDTDRAAAFADLGGMQFSGSDLSSAQLMGARLDGVCFDSVRLEAADLTGADFGERPALKGLDHGQEFKAVACWSGSAPDSTSVFAAEGDHIYRWSGAEYRERRDARAVGARKGDPRENHFTALLVLGGGQWLVSGSRKQLCLWSAGDLTHLDSRDLQTPAQRGKPFPKCCVLVALDDHTFYCGVESKVHRCSIREDRGRVWLDIELLHEESGQVDFCRGMALSADKKFLFCGGGLGRGGTIAKLDVISCRIVHRFQFPEKVLRASRARDQKSFINQLCLVNESLFSADGNGSVLQWNAVNCSFLRVVSPSGPEIFALCLSPDNQYLFAGGTGGNVTQWQVSTGESIRSFRAHAVTVWSMCVLPQSNIIVTASKDKSVKLWPPRSALERKWQGHHDTVYSLLLRGSGDDSRLYSCSSDSTIVQWSAETGQLLNVTSTNERLKAIADVVAPDSQEAEAQRSILAAGRDHLYVVDASLADEPRRVSVENPEVMVTCPLSSCVYVASGPRIVKLALDPRNILWQQEDKASVKSLWQQEDKASVKSLALSDCGRYLFSGYDVGRPPDGYVVVRDAKTGTPLHTSRVGSGSPVSLCWLRVDANSGTLFAAMGQSGTFCCCNIRLPTPNSGSSVIVSPPIVSAEEHSDWANVVVVGEAHSRRVIYVGGGDGLISLWRLEGSRLEFLCKWCAHPRGEIRALVASDGCVYSAASDMTVRKWQTPNPAATTSASNGGSLVAAGVLLVWCSGPFELSAVNATLTGTRGGSANTQLLEQKQEASKGVRAPGNGGGSRGGRGGDRGGGGARGGARGGGGSRDAKRWGR